MSDRQVKITELVLRDAHQSLIATRMRLEDMLPIAAALDDVGYWSIESWGGATFDACIRYLGEDPWERLRALKKAMPKTRQQMLLRGQNLLGYRHYADDVVEAFVERAATNGIDVFRIFDAMNDVRNLQTAIRAVLAIPNKHAQGTISYTVSPVHQLETWLEMAKRMEDLGVHSIAIKDMAGLLMPKAAFELVSALKATVKVPIHLHAHATTGLSMATIIKAVEGGVDAVDTAISPFSMTYGHSPTETVVAMLSGTEHDTGLDLEAFGPIAKYFKSLRTKYAQFEGQLKGVDARILMAQVPGGMLTNMENQLKEQNALDRFDEVLNEIPRVREDLGFIPLVTPTSQIVGTQAVINVLTGERYGTIARETQALLRGEYGAAPAPFNAELQQKVLQSKAPMTQRPADALAPEMSQLTESLKNQAQQEAITLAEEVIDDVLTVALFPQVGLDFLKHRGDLSHFEAPPGEQSSAQSSAAQVQAQEKPSSASSGPSLYQVKVDGQVFQVEVVVSGDEANVVSTSTSSTPATATAASSNAGSDLSANNHSAQSIVAPLAGRVCRVLVKENDAVTVGQTLLILEAMKMETEIKAHEPGRIVSIGVRDGQMVVVGETLIQMTMA